MREGKVPDMCVVQQVPSVIHPAYQCTERMQAWHDYVQAEQAPAERVFTYSLLNLRAKVSRRLEATAWRRAAGALMVLIEGLSKLVASALATAGSTLCTWGSSNLKELSELGQPE